jgi:capsular exopolysaccharide synthesis family protein
VTDHRPEEHEGINVGEVLAGLKRRAWIIVLAIALCSAGAYALSQSRPKTYESSTSLLVGEVGSVQTILRAGPPPGATSDREIQTKIKLLTTPVIVSGAAEKLRGRPQSVDALSAIKVSADPKSNLVLITASSPAPHAAADAANAYADAAIDFRRRSDKQQIRTARNLLSSEVKRLRASADTSRAAKKEARKLDQQIAELDTAESIQTGNVQVVQGASVPLAPASPNPRRDAMVGAFAGLLLGLAIALAGEQLDRRVRRSKELEGVFDLPLLAAVPVSPSLHTNGHRLTEIPAGESEAFHMLRVNLVHPDGDDHDLKSVLITSSSVADGKSTVALNLAASAAIAGARVLLIEGDVRAPRFAQLLGLSEDRGVSSLLEIGDVDVHSVPVGDWSNGNGGSSMDVMVAGPPAANPTKLMESSQLMELVRKAEGDYDLVVIDAPPATVVSDPIALAARVDGVIIVASLRSTTPDSALRLYKQMRRVNAPMLGVVANFAEGAESRYYGYHRKVKA